MREAVHDGNLRIVLDAEMSKMSPEQRVALASLNEEAKKRLAEIVAFDADKEKDMEQSGEEEIRETVVDTPFEESIVDRLVKGPVTLPGIEAEEAARRQVTNSIRYTQETLADEFARIFKDEIMALRNAGQKEYAHDDSSPFANFERGAKDMGIDRKQVLWVYAMKHKDGIAAFLKGNISQREDVRGRVNDLIVYLLLFRGMLNEEFGNTGNFGFGIWFLRRKSVIRQDGTRDDG